MSSDRIQSVERAIQILEAFNQDVETLTLTEIANAVDLPKSTTTRMLRTLVDHGLISEEAKRYRLGIKLFILGNLVSKNNNLHKTVRPIMEQLGEESGDLITLNILIENQRLCIGKVEPKQEVQISIPLGRLLPAYAGAAGKVLLAFLPEDRIRNILGSIVKEKFTPNTETDVNAIMVDLERIREQGYFFSRSERLEGVWGIAAPIKEHTGEVVASISMGGLNIHLNEELIEKKKGLLKDAARQASILLGCNPKIL